jgi:hypothetical protein
LPVYETFPAKAREWIAEKPTHDFWWELDDDLGATDIGSGKEDLGDPDYNRRERMLPHDGLAAKPKVKLSEPTAYEQLSTLFAKFADIAHADFACGNVKDLVRQVAINKAVYPTEKVLVTLFATALYSAGVPMKVILSRLDVSRRAIMSWLDDWDTFIEKEFGSDDDSRPKWRSLRLPVGNP